MRLQIMMGFFGVLLIGAPVAKAADPLECPAAPKNKRKARKAAKQHWKNGVRYFEIGAYEKAMNSFYCANSIKPHPLAMFNVAKAAEKAKHYKIAGLFYRKYLGARRNAPERARIEGKIRLLQQLAQEKRRREEREKEEARRRKEQPRQIIVIHKPAPVDTKNRARTYRLAGWTNIGVAGASLLAGVVLAGLAGHAKATVENADRLTDWSKELEQPYNNYSKYLMGTYICAGIGGAALLAGAVLLVLERKWKKQESSSVSILPALGRGNASLTLNVMFP